MPAPGVEEVRAWLGRVMVDRDGNRLGEITNIYLDNETDRPEWAVVRTGLFGLRSSFVPLADASRVGDQIQVPHDRSLVRGAPNIEADGQLTGAEEAELYRHYGLDYDTVTPDSEPATSRSGGLVDDEQSTAPAATEEPTAAPTGGPVERRTDEELQVTEAVGPAEPVTGAGLEVGEGMSRPFVYETPGPAQGRPGSPRRRPGQVRLRRYLVTEVVTETETGERHELQVQREPVDEAEVAGVPMPSGQSAEPVAEAPAEPNGNDWFRPEENPAR